MAGSRKAVAERGCLVYVIARAGKVSGFRIAGLFRRIRFYDSKKNWPIPCREEIYQRDA
jgi:hypothetical protein